MPSKSRWRLNPKKWFGKKTHAVQKQESASIQPPPPTATTTTRTVTTGTTTSINTKIVPLSFANVMSRTNITTTNFQLPAFAVRRDRNLSTFSRSNTFQPTHTEPTIRKNSRIEENLLIDVTRLNISTIQRRIPEDFEQDRSSKLLETSVSNLSHRCLVDYPRQRSPHLDENSLPSRSSSPGSSVLNHENDNSSSSGIFTDERQRTGSKDTLSNLEVLSIESIADSQTSLNQMHSRPIIHHYRRPMSVFETTEEKPQQRQKSVNQSHRSHSAEGILKDNQTVSSSKTRQSSAMNDKKIDKRLPTSRSRSGKLEKTGFVRVTPDTYRLTTHTIDHFSFQTRRNSNHSFVPHLEHDDVLRSADIEEHYANIPRTSSTEYLNNNNNNNIQNDIRSMIDDCIRPLITSIGKNQATKNNRFRRPQIQQTQLNIEKITDRLLASIDSSIYSRYQRCN